MATRSRVEPTPKASISARMAVQIRANSGRTVGTAAIEAKMCWRTAIAGAVMSAVIVDTPHAVGSAAGAAVAVLYSPSHRRTSGSSMSESNSRTLSGGGCPMAACCAPTGVHASASTAHTSVTLRPPAHAIAE